MKRSFRIVGWYNTYSNYNEAKKLERASEWVEVYCPAHGWEPTTSSGECLACYREEQGLTPREEKT